MKVIFDLMQKKMIIGLGLLLTTPFAGQAQDFGKQPSKISSDVVQRSDKTAYNIRMTLRFNNMVFATPQITMFPGKAELIANGHNNQQPYKLVMTLLDGNEIHTRFPNKSSFDNSVFFETALYMPTSPQQPTAQWQKTSSPGAILETNGQQVQIRSDASSLDYYTIALNGREAELLREISWSISALPTRMTQQ